MLARDVTRMAEALLAAHLPGRGWTFGFDRAVRRAGACHHADRRITVSRHLVERAEEDEVRQVLLHEVAHALAGHRAAHGPRWRRTAAGIGYTGSRLHDRPIAEDRATWIGACPAGHEHRRFRRPARDTSCGLCSRTFSRAALITWRRVEPDDALTGPSAADPAVRTVGSAAGSPVSEDRSGHSVTWTSFQNAT